MHLVSVSLSFSLSLSCFCGFFRDPYLRVRCPNVEPETGVLVQIICEEDLWGNKSKGQRGAGWDRRKSLAKMLHLKFSLPLVPWRAVECVLQH